MNAVHNNWTTYAVPISCKGIVFENNKVWLRWNERKEWELPGGKLDLGEQPEQTVAREMREELGVDVRVDEPVATYLYTITASSDEANGVFVVCYSCQFQQRIGDVEHEGEAGPSKFEQFTLEQIAGLPMPDFYKDAIRRAASS